MIGVLILALLKNGLPKIGLTGRLAARYHRRDTDRRHHGSTLSETAKGVICRIAAFLK